VERRRGGRVASRCGIGPAAELQGDPISVMSRYDEFYIGTFRPLIMIVASFGRYLPISGHDHEAAQSSF
jgi:hypothetical protein